MENYMEGLNETPARKERYILEQEDCDALRDIQAMIVALTPTAGDEDLDHDSPPEPRDRIDTAQCLAEISIKIGRLLDNVCWKNVHHAR
jgi:hypothetical protein